MIGIALVLTFASGPLDLYCWLQVWTASLLRMLKPHNILLTEDGKGKACVIKEQIVRVASGPAAELALA